MNGPEGKDSAVFSGEHPEISDAKKQDELSYLISDDLLRLPEAERVAIVLRIAQRDGLDDDKARELARSLHLNV